MPEERSLITLTFRGSPDQLLELFLPPPDIWTEQDAKQLACSVQLLRHGLQIHLALNTDTPYCSRTFHTQDELLAWAEEQRVQNLAAGWS